MAKKKKAKRRNASSGGAAMRGRGGGGGGGGGRGGSKNDKAVKNVAIAVGGGALGALAAGIAVGAGVNPKTAAVATLAGGALGAYALKGNAKVAAIGAACAASGQLALAWQVKRQAEQAARKSEQGKLEQAQAAQSAQPQLAQGPTSPGTPKRNAANGYFDDDDGGDDDDLRNAGVVDDFVDDIDEAA